MSYGYDVHHKTGYIFYLAILIFNVGIGTSLVSWSFILMLQSALT